MFSVVLLKENRSVVVFVAQDASFYLATCHLLLTIYFRLVTLPMDNFVNTELL